MVKKRLTRPPIRSWTRRVRRPCTRTGTGNRRSWTPPAPTSASLGLSFLICKQGSRTKRPGWFLSGSPGVILRPLPSSLDQSRPQSPCPSPGLGAPALGRASVFWDKRWLLELAEVGATEKPAGQEHMGWPGVINGRGRLAARGTYLAGNLSK